MLFNDSAAWPLDPCSMPLHTLRLARPDDGVHVPCALTPAMVRDDAAGVHVSLRPERLKLYQFAGHYRDGLDDVIVSWLYGESRDGRYAATYAFPDKRVVGFYAAVGVLRQREEDVRDAQRVG